MMGAPEGITVRRVSPEDFHPLVPELARLLAACVADGASIGFLHPVGPAQAEAYWSSVVLPDLEAGALTLWVAEQGKRLVGTVQLSRPRWASHRCRADVLKLLVDPEARRRGIARHLMDLLLDEARAQGIETLVLDTRVPDHAQALYESLGFVAVGEIPGFVLDPLDPAKRDATLYMYLSLV